MSRKPCSSNSEHSHSADSTSASGVALPYFSSSRRSSDPAFTPIRIGTSGAGGRPGDLADLVVELPDVARVHPHRRAAGVDRGEDVLRLEVDVRDHRDLRLARDHRRARRRRPARGRPPGRSGSRTRSAPRSAGASRRRRRSRVVVIDCTDTGASPPTATDPTWIWRLSRRSASLIGTDGIPSEIAVICCASPRCGSRSQCDPERDSCGPPGGLGHRRYGNARRRSTSCRSGAGRARRLSGQLRSCHAFRRLQVILTGFTTSAIRTSTVKQRKIPATT